MSRTKHKGGGIHFSGILWTRKRSPGLIFFVGK